MYPSCRVVLMSEALGIIYYTHYPNNTELPARQYLREATLWDRRYMYLYSNEAPMRPDAEGGR